MPTRLEGDFFVSPVYLAGSRTIGDPGLQPLLGLGFTLAHDDLGNAYVTSPDQCLRLGYLPEGPDNILWKITAHRHPFDEPEWMATFDAGTPTELVTAFTSTLADGYRNDPDTTLFSPHQQMQEGWFPLQDAGWQLDSGRLITVSTAPDRLAGLAYSGRFLTRQAELHGDEQRWVLWGGQDGYHSGWCATFTSGVPKPLIAATTARLASQDPVLRYGPEIPKLNRSAARIRPVPPPVPTPLEVQRATAARARSQGHRLAATRAVAHTAAGTLSAALPVRTHHRPAAAARL
ncbi:DUF317 domain-containing protein [Streptomyces sp. NPDC050264]|uniref:DUF317 domain-containing protein n=1 Tax=Streptomyces sp. NPDC050264 TaxID=3155038 RepID=UPI0034359C85